ncbi:DNA polymerase-1 [Agromyces flavus]|uniref:DNA-directed DNA polymerase n=1 Tax=Agromyces flavus TaxID=589382 RepID=A0A1H1RXA7_9MICO|nr:bifunctional 3'-5' exonuclease/DNA polymerase [Agromyces flavus]MCP2368891.1 DNA polymerase-1 [Agromyces flavus]GGI48348.1 bifunctional 3'-5' exonuclease/DNA polymerase [Agromyces flavus]SDS39619.1 DNA polymerase-1 [Agromyces flavus]
MRIAVAATRDGRALLVDPAGGLSLDVERERLPDEIARLEAELRPRWVWRETREWAPELLDAGVRVARCHDLRLCGAILASSAFVDDAGRSAAARPAWLPPGPAEAPDLATAVNPAQSGHRSPALFDLDVDVDPGGGPSRAVGLPTARELIDEHDRQLALVDGSDRRGALRLLMAAESAGALIAAELHAAGLPWNRAVHERVLEEALGPRPAPGRKPARMEQLADAVRAALEAPTLNLDSQADLLRALRGAGIGAESTARWELREHDHPAIEPLIAYKRLARLLSANGWSWLDEWVVAGRFRADWVAGGTATGRWATAGGGALQLPKAIRRAVSADDGWTLVVADASQLEPRVLAALARDPAMAAAGRGRDMYRAIVEAGVVATRDEAKVALLGAMYGATTGDSGRLVPRLARAYPRAMALVDRAARDGEAGRSVTTLLGRSSPLPPPRWHELQARATQPDATQVDERRARAAAREWGRFTRNFVVQGTAAEWALCWLAGVRNRLVELGEQPERATAADASGSAFARIPHLVYFLHDELIVHTPLEFASAVADAVGDAAAEAGRLLFGEAPVEFPLNLVTTPNYGSAT